MRIIFLLIDLLVVLGLISGAIYCISRLIAVNRREKQWHNWKKKEVNLKNLTILEMLEDVDQLILAVQHKIPKEALESLHYIASTITVLSKDEKSFNDWRNRYSEESTDLIDILYKHIPESLNRYFSVPEIYTNKQKHRNGKNANDLLIETFKTFESRFNSIASQLVSEHLNELKVYQSFIHTKYDDKEIEY